MKSTPLDTLEPLTALARKHWNVSEEISVVELTGGASTRRFFRVQVDARSAVGMYSPDARRSEEASHSRAEEEREWPFLELQRLLEEHGVRVPRLLEQDCQRGWLLLEDLGDLTLAEALIQRPELKPQFYELAVRDLAQAQVKLARLPDESVVRQRHFDEKLLLWELQHFHEFGLLARGITPTAHQNERFDRLATELARGISALDVGFVHRDYQSRNLMWLPHDLKAFEQAAWADLSGLRAAGELVWIDFQDALMGPRVYDLVALLNDSYQEFSPEFVQQRLRNYVAARGLPASAHETIAREFDMVTVQRKLKDAGRFVYFDVHNHDPSYLRFVEPTLTKVVRSLERLQGEPLFSEWLALLEDLAAR